MALDPQLLEILACPDTHHAPLDLRRRGADADLHRVRPDLRGPRRHAGAAARRGARRPRAGVMIDGAAGVSGHRDADEALLDNPEALAEADPGGMLRATASAGAQVARAAALAAEADLARARRRGPAPRRRRSPASAPPRVPATCWPLSPGRAARCRSSAHRSAGVPGWVGAADVVIAVSASGRSPEALGAAEAAAPPRCPAGRRRRARLPAAGDRRAGPGAVHPGAPACPGPGQPLGAHRAGAARRPFARAGEGHRGGPRGDRGPARRGRRPVPARPPSPSSTRRSRWRSAWPARSRSSGARPRWPRWRPAGSATRCRPTPATRWSPGRSVRPAGVGSGCSTASSAAWPRATGTSSPTRRRGRRRGPTRLRLVLLRDGGLNAEDDTDEPLAVEERRADAVQTLAERRGVRCDVVDRRGRLRAGAAGVADRRPGLRLGLPCSGARAGPDGRARPSPR